MKTDGFDEVCQYLPCEVRERLLKLPDEIRCGVNEIRMVKNRPLSLSVGNSTCLPDAGGNLLCRCDPRLPPILPHILDETFMLLCERSVYSHQEELRNGFLTLKNGHRVGVCGTGVVNDKKVESIRDISSLNIRIAREIKGCSRSVTMEDVAGGLIIAGPPGSGKTTLLRDIIRRLADGEFGNIYRVSVADERGELAACHDGVPGNDLGIACDVLAFIPKATAIGMAVRTMTPRFVAFDEVGSDETAAVASAASCGVDFLTTVHASNTHQLYKNKVFAALQPFVKNIIMLGAVPGEKFEKYQIRTDENEIVRGISGCPNSLLYRDISGREADTTGITA